jgi:hypothetical protein
MAELYEVEQRIREISNNLSVLVVESDESKRVKMAVTVKEHLDEIFHDLRAAITQIHIEAESRRSGSSVAMAAESKMPEPERPPADRARIDKFLNTYKQPITSELLWFLKENGYFNADPEK